VYVVMFGGGEVAYYLSKQFIDGGHEVLLIESDPKKRERLEEALGDITLGGNGCRIQCLDQAGVSRADVFIAATDADEDNLAACQLAMIRFGVPRVLSILNNPRNRNIFRKLGIEHTIDVADLVLENMKAQIPVFPLVRIAELEGEELEVVQVRIAEGSALLGKALGDTRLAFLSDAACIVRSGEAPHAADASTHLEEGDTLICVVARETLGKLQSELALGSG